MNTLAERLREIRGGLSQAEFAERFGVHKNTVWKWENDEASPDFESLQKMILEYELSPEWLMLGEGGKHAPALKDFTPRTVPAATYMELMDEFNKRAAIHKENLDELSTLRKTVKQATHEIMVLNAEIREYRKVEKAFHEYLGEYLIATMNEKSHQKVIDAIDDLVRGLFSSPTGDYFAALVRKKLAANPGKDIGTIEKEEKEYQEYLAAAAAQVRDQLDENPELGIPLDPDVAEYMGAFEEHAVTVDDLLGEDEDEDSQKDGSGVKPKGSSSKKSAR